MKNLMGSQFAGQIQWRIQSWSQGGFPSRKFKWLVKVGECKDVNPLIKKNHGPGGGVSGQPENPPEYATEIHT